MLDRDRHGCRRRRTPIKPVGLTFDYPGGRVEILVAPLDAPARDLSPARAALSRRLIAGRATCAESDVAIVHDADGAPHVAAPQRGLHISMSGRDGLVAAAAADHAVGLDIETVAAPFDPPLNVLHAAERAALTRAGESAHEIFLRIWTAKEAYVKALGTGLAREPSDIEIRLPPSAAAATADYAVMDCGQSVRTALARGARLVVGRRPVILACLVLPG